MRYFWIISLILCGQMGFAQTNIWATLGKVTFRSEFDKAVGYPVQYPKFTPEITALKGKTVTLKGYIVPMSESKGYFALSLYPFQSCYFCGGAGIETVMEMYSKKPLKATSQAITVKGKLKLNDFDVMNHLVYILEDAEIVK